MPHGNDGARNDRAHDHQGQAAFGILSRLLLRAIGSSGSEPPAQTDHRAAAPEGYENYDRGLCNLQRGLPQSRQDCNLFDLLQKRIPRGV